MKRKNTGIRLAIKIVVLLLTGLFFTTAALASNLEVNVETNKGRALSGLSVYAFTGSGSYTGISAATGENGTAIFDSDDFEAGTYKFRVDYLGNRFWSQVISLPETSLVNVVLDEETAEVTVTTGAGPAQGVNVYLFTGSGSYLSNYGNTGADGKVSFDLPVGRDFKFRADISGNRYWSDVTTILAGGPNHVPVDAGGGLFQVTVEKGPGVPMEGINTYLFNTSGTYLGLSQVTNSSGVVGFNVPEGNYKVRADYLGYKFWSQETLVTENTSISLAVPHQDVVITVQGMYQGTPDPIEGINVYLFTLSGSYLSQYQVTGGNGQVTFNLPGQAYKVRADYLGQKLWSGEFTWQNTTVNIPMADAEITVTGSGQPLEGVKIYAFSSSGSYLNINDTADVNGRATFRVPAGLYKFRADYQGSQYWSSDETLIADQVNPIEISTGGGTFSLTVLKGVADPLVGANCYVFSEGGSYLGMSAATDGNGQVSFALADGTYKFRVDYLGNQFWTPVYTVPATFSDEFIITHQDVVITVEGTCQGTPEPKAGLKVYLFTPSGSYLNQYQVTDASGHVTFNLPGQPYKVRTDYLGQQFWSGEFTWQNTTVNIPMADAEITVTGSGQPLEGVNVYAFSSSGSYLNITETTDMNGRATFRVPAGLYNFLADYQGSQYWSGEETLTSDQVNPVAISTGGGTFTLTVLKGAANPLAGANCYAFSEGGSYLGMSAATDGNGQVSFALADGMYKFRVDYLGNQFWTPVYTVPATFSDEFIITHQDVVITVEGTYQGTPEPKAGLKVYLFTPSGSYLNRYQVTDSSGHVTFNLPGQPYKVRADHLGQQFWSGEFTWQDTTVGISQGMARVHVKRGTADVQGANVYLFTESGSYLSRYEVTDSSGMAGFLLPARTFKFRADEGRDQVWSDPVAITIDQVNDVDLNLGAVPPTVSISSDPATINAGESSTLSWNSTEADTVTIDQGIGEVDLTGSTNVSPTETTTYTITATGPGGTATDGVTVTVSSTVPVETKLYASDAADFDLFGYSVCINGDYAIVGAFYDDTGGYGGYDSGSAYIFKREGSAWIEQAKLIASDTEEYDEFGYSVCINGDYAIVGAPYDDTDGYGDSDSGAAYIFKRDGSAWIEEAKLVPGDTEAYNYFGNSVSISGDYAIVGAPYNDAGGYGGYDTGAAYIFKRDGSSWIEEAKLIAGDAADYDYFGYSVSISGDYAIVGASGHDEGGYGGYSDSGAAYIFKRDGSSWIEEVKLIPADTEASDYFGSSVALSGDHAIVGAPGDDSGGYGSGSAYIFKYDGTNWNEQYKLAANDAEAYEAFGSSVAMSSGFAIVGAPYDDAEGYGVYYSGSAYIYSHEGFIGAPIVSISVDPVNILIGETSTLAWTSTDADSASIDQGIGTVDVTGLTSISPNSITTYTITVTGPGGMATSSVTVNVIDPDVPPAVNISATPTTIEQGNSSTLTWTTTNAASAAIDNGVGDVPVNGSITVSPTETATYTITATGPAGTATANVTVIVTYPQPTVEITADPGTIMIGSSSTLSWSSTDANSVSMDQGIGSVDANGSMAVSPTETTNYTITATGPGGTATDSVTVFVNHPPTVSISADPETILVGGSCTLTWTSNHTDSATIDNGIGDVPVNGSITVSPAETTSYTITVAGPGGTAMAGVTVTVISLSITITSPVDGDTIYRPDIIVQGTIPNIEGNEMGVAVNGVIAMVEGTQFVANHVPLQEGENTITASSTNPNGGIESASITVYAETTGNYITITADPQSGISPFETILRVEGSFSFTGEPVLTYDGPDEVEFIENPNENEYTVSITTPGIYYFTAEVTDDQSNTYTDTVAVLVLDVAELDALLRAKWEGMKTALTTGDIETAVTYFSANRRDAYNEVFQAARDQIASILPDSQNIEIVKICDGKARYIADIEIDVNGQPMTVSSYIIFELDKDGLWSIICF
jgi:hypothetical protein